ncbi:MAG: stage IV sporulation protein B [Bacilli bacterium]|nr:stage IV sporulation protein B [Bacilli bacterium]
MKKFILIFILLVFPINVFAYSNKLIVGGETIGIEVHSNGVYVVGFYPVNGKNIGEESGFMIGDIIKKINGIDVSSINNLNSILDSDSLYKFSIIRNGKSLIISMQLEEENNILKTGLYVKDTINGIGTLSYIDPETNIFGSLGHEILESKSYSKFEIGDGSIYSSTVNNIRKSTNGNTGEKKAIINKSNEIGSIIINEETGIYGKYRDNYSNREMLEVGDVSSIKKGEAYIKTVISENDIKDYSINILNIDESNSTKNILFEITDKNLLKITGGIVQGMSGSPIIQNNKIIGVVNYVIVDDTKRGYGIFITKMLEEGDKIVS